MKNPFISQLEYEIKKDYAKPLVRETYKMALKLNNCYNNMVLMQEDRAYIKKLYKAYLINKR